jgi:ABC-type Fe3+/spermidine/putrescine transport system ATPase subunit
MLLLEEIEKQFASQKVLRSVSFTVSAGEIVVLLGASGSGKTTLLRIIAGLETADSGRILLDGRDLSPIPIHRRGFGLVFQDFALFPHKNVADNVAFGLRMLGWTAAEIAPRVEEVLALVELPGYAERTVYQLSGGEQQRVALARSLAPSPRLLLLDEPLGSLDRALRERLMLDLRAILKSATLNRRQPTGDRVQATTSIYVTHDQTEAFAIADRVLIMNHGRIEQSGTPVELYRHPATPFIARFLGMENLLDGRITATGQVQTALGELQVAEAAHLPAGQPVTLLIRPRAARLVPAGEAAPNLISGRLQDISFRGRYQVATIQPSVPESANATTPPPLLRLEFESTTPLPLPGTPLHLTLTPARLQTWPVP